MVSLEQVAKSFGGRPVVQRTSFSVAKGERVALIGGSGSGKSTLLKIILGLVVPDEGKVIVGGVVVDASSARMVRRRVGYVIQDGGLFPHLSAKDNVTLVSRLDAAPIADARVTELADLVRLRSALLAKRPRELSGGERQRVGLMRALALDPDVLLLDEPLGALDPLVRAALQDDLRQIFLTLGKCVVLVTHDMAEAAFLAQRMAVMKEGAILQEGSMRDLLDHPKHPFVGELIHAQRSLEAAAS